MSSRVFGEGHHVLVLDFPGAGPYDPELSPAIKARVPWTIADYQARAEWPRETTIILNAGDWPITAAELDRVPRCRCIISYGVGVDYIDPELAASRGVVVVNTPHANVIDVAEHSLALILACAKRLADCDRSVREGRWRPNPGLNLRRLQGQTLGLLAFGNIARHLSRLAQPLHLNQCGYDPYVPAETMRSLGVDPVDFEELAARADICSVHLPATRETRGFLSADRIAKFKFGSVLVITSRGAVYDAEALADALSTGRIGAAGLDVFPTEPLPKDHPLTRLTNVILTPHHAGATVDADRDARAAVAASLADVFEGRHPASSQTFDRLHGSALMHRSQTTD